jgi:ATP-dependent Clp protease protease subunit
MKKTWNFQLRGDKKAEVLLYGDVGDMYYGGCSAKSFIEELRSLGEIDELTVRINSQGGSIMEGFAIYETLRQHKAKVIVQVDGLAASIASVIAMAGDTINMAESSFLMIHRGWNICAGDADAMRACATTLEMMEVKILDAYLRHAKNVGRNELFDMMKAETWIPAEEAEQLGLADAVIKPDEAAAMAFDLSRFKHPPAALAAKATPPSGEVAEVLAAQAQAEEIAVRLRLIEMDEMGVELDRNLTA